MGVRDYTVGTRSHVEYSVERLVEGRTSSTWRFVASGGDRIAILDYAARMRAVGEKVRVVKTTVTTESEVVS